MHFILALDQGTTSSRAVVFDRDGAVRGLAQKEFGQIYPRPGWVEHDPDDIWSSQIGVAHEALARAGAAPGDIAAIGITNQRETTVVWDRATGRPIANAIVWQDRRTADLCERLRREGHEPTFAARTGLKLDPYFSGTKIAWILEQVPDARRLADLGRLAFGTVDSWLVWQLSGGAAHVTDATNASRTLLYDIRADRWDDELLGILNVPRSMLPRVCASSGIAAATDLRVFGAQVPVAGIAGDQHAALFGQCCFAPGMVKNTYGTGCFMLLHTGAAPVHAAGGLLATTAWRIGERSEYALEGSVFIAGAVVQWLRDGLRIIRSSAEVEALASSVPDNGGVYLVPAFTGLGAPHWDPHARGTICGLTRGATAAHIARAAIESIAFQSAEVLAAMQSAGVPVTELRVDGGAARNDLLMQFQADLLGVPVARPAQTESTALGAAYLAGLAVGYWRDRDELATHWKLERRFEPGMDRAQAAALLDQWRRAVERSRDWARD